MQPPDICPTCGKAAELCICEAVTPFENRPTVLILRHPQEQDQVLGTARLVTLQLKNASLRTGLSWANLTKALGLPADAKRWGVLYLGPAKTGVVLQRPLTVVTKDGAPLEGQDDLLRSLEGIIALDGNWQQAKALWWRNAWLLKCRRLVLRPARPSLYGQLRQEPRRESVSTIEAVAQTLAILGGDPALEETLLQPFKLLLAKARQVKGKKA